MHSRRRHRHLACPVHVVRHRRAHVHRRKYHLLIVEVRVQPRNGRIRLKLLPQIDDDNECGDRTGHSETKPHEALGKRSAVFGYVAHSMQRRIVEELLGLVAQAGPQQARHGQMAAGIPGGTTAWRPVDVMHSGERARVNWIVRCFVIFGQCKHAHAGAR